jgi:hypothetical protein
VRSVSHAEAPSLRCPSARGTVVLDDVAQRPRACRIPRGRADERGQDSRSTDERALWSATRRYANRPPGSCAEGCAEGPRSARRDHKRSGQLEQLQEMGGKHPLHLGGKEINVRHKK